MQPLRIVDGGGRHNGDWGAVFLNSHFISTTKGNSMPYPVDRWEVESGIESQLPLRIGLVHFRMHRSKDDLYHERRRGQHRFRFMWVLDA